MALSQTTINAAADRSVPVLNEALAKSQKRTAFLCHSHKDQKLVKGVVVLLREAGWDVYVDWADSSMPEKPNRETASKIRKKIVELNYFLFLATQNSVASRWCPWEIGYADGKKSIDSIIVIPTKDTAGSVHGNEYLELYRRLDESTANQLAVWEPGTTTDGTLVKNLR